MTYLYQGDVGVDVTVSTGKDLTSASTNTLKVKKPSGTEVTWSASKVAGTGGNLTYTTITGDLDEVGTYYLQAYIVMGDGDIFYGDVVRFVVYDQFQEA